MVCDNFLAKLVKFACEGERMSEKLNYKPSKDEERIFNECMDDCFWYRSLPAAGFAGAAVFICIRTGKIPSTKYGAAPKVLTASGLFYALAKASYLLGEECDNKFLAVAPRSEMADRIRYNRGNKERTLWMECTREAVLYRALPATCVTSLGVRVATQGRRLSVLLTLMAGCTAFMLGFYSYMNLERRCQQKFDKYLKENPDSDLSWQLKRLKTGGEK